MLQAVFYGSWTVGFVLWRRWTGWTYRRGPLMVSQLLGAVGLLCIWQARGAASLGLGLGLFGLGLIGSYVASVFYGLDRYYD